MTGKPQALIVAPFWRERNHIGKFRVASFIRWLREAGMDVAVVCSGQTDDLVTHDWGREFGIRDPLRLSWTMPAQGTTTGSAARPSGMPQFLRQWGSALLSRVLAPDLEILWAHRVARDRRLLAEHWDWVISSNPPESAHVAAVAIARRSKADLLADMRDGWLDQPLKAVLETSRLRRWREGRQEADVLRRARRVFVTSDSWRALLVERVPAIRDKITVLTNGYPDGESSGPSSAALGRIRSSTEMRLIHAGRFTGSRHNRAAALLLDPLLTALRDSQTQGMLTVLGDLPPRDLADLANYQEQFGSVNWRIEVSSSIPRIELAQRLRECDGLLLLSVSPATLPLKLFDCLPARRPMLAVTPPDGAVWEVCRDLPQAYLVDVRDPAPEVVRQFLRACLEEAPPCIVPVAFSDVARRETFWKALGLEGQAGVRRTEFNFGRGMADR